MSSPVLGNYGIHERFWSKVNKHGPKVKRYVYKLYLELKGTRCWIWIGAKDRDGYGLFQIKTDKTVRVHKLVARYYIRRKKGFDCHKCDVPSCVNPAHIFKGTPLSNMQDRDRKGRKADTSGSLNGMWKSDKTRGEKNAQAKLTVHKVKRLRKIWALGMYSQSALGNKFGVTQTLVSQIVRRKVWASV